MVVACKAVDLSRMMMRIDKGKTDLLLTHFHILIKVIASVASNVRVY